MAFVPAGLFIIGNSIGDGDITDAIPTNVYVSAFYMDTNLVSLSQWQSLYSYATGIGYSFTNVGASKATNHPVQTVNWFDCVKWCNARSQQAGLTPVYYTDAGLTQIFTNGDTGTTVFANWTANGYRLPTEAEWEKAARGGLNGRRFPWGNLISENQANYVGATNLYSYDLGPNGTNAIGLIGGYPYTSPVGSFDVNGYGLYDMAGNVFEWCWDWYGGTPYQSGSAYLGGTDPRGAPTGIRRVERGGSWAFGGAGAARSAARNFFNPSLGTNSISFRCVRGL
jgi:formylglycine-generating enzyme required for sulfatase activity